MASAAQRKIKSVSYAKYGYYFILPFFLAYCFFQIWPLINTFILSFYGNGPNSGASAGISEENFVGFDNFSALFFGGEGRRIKAIHNNFTRDLVNTVIVWIGNFIPQILLSLSLAVWFTDAKLKIKGKGFFKVIMYMPNIITAASVAALFYSIFNNYDTAPANRLLMSLGIIDEPILFVRGVWPSRIMVMVIQCWMWFGNTMIMLMSGIMGLNPSLFEAANIDGATSGQVFRKITLPLLRPIMLYTLITSMIGGLQMFDIPFLYKEGQLATEHIETIAVYIYTNFMRDPKNKGISGAASVILFFITVALGCILFAMNRDKDEAAKKKERKAYAKSLKKQSKLGGIDI